MQLAKNVHQNILSTIGNTPMIRMHNMTQDFPCPVFAKVEYFNPGHSVKDRMALRMIEDAEREGNLRPGALMPVVVQPRLPAAAQRRRIHGSEYRG